MRHAAAVIKGDIFDMNFLEFGYKFSRAVLKS